MPLVSTNSLCHFKWEPRTKQTRTHTRSRRKGWTRVEDSHLLRAPSRYAPNFRPQCAARTVSNLSRPLAQRHHSRSSSSVVLPPPHTSRPVAGCAHTVGTRTRRTGRAHIPGAFHPLLFFLQTSTAHPNPFFFKELLRPKS